MLLPVWQFGRDDLSDFVDQHTIPQWSTRSPFDLSNPSNAELIWARLYDYCYSTGCHYWGISTYNFWVFGMFSKNYSHGWTTEIYSSDSKDPIVFQFLVYWMHSAFGGANTLPIPTISLGSGDVLTDELPCACGRLWGSNPGATSEILGMS
ncbi:hypothetical protein BD410DRAFT_361600 [Rickenella mellea]|uniref:Uncharacterized protein n=1 Tax=Rickenella mellea TaxID=50990 RepID=A0A4Y7PYZ3_9AGAM|nr:hypothetical protein BD410DRAFT_361600 [Rickenella mellea]